MKLFIDSAVLSDIKSAFSYGIIDGVTTNPSLLNKAVQGKKLQLSKYLESILLAAKGCPVSLEVVETKSENIVKEGKKLFMRFNPVAKNVWIKVPIHTSMKKGANTDGLRAIKQLSSMGIPINCTLVFTPEQALLAAKAGATVVSPFAGRVDDFIRSKHNISFEKTDYFPSFGWRENNHTLEDNGVVSGIDLVRQCKQILSHYQYSTGVLAASLRSPRHVREAALVHADIATIPFPVIQELLAHPKTVEGMIKFTKDIVPEYKRL